MDGSVGGALTCWWVCTNIYMLSVRGHRLSNEDYAVVVGMGLGSIFSQCNCIIVALLQTLYFLKYGYKLN